MGVEKVVGPTAPDGEDYPLKGDVSGAEWVAEWHNTLTTGVYTVKAPDREPVYYAVAYEAGEDDLTAMEADEQKIFKDTVVHRFLKTYPELEVSVQEETGVSEWWRWFVFGALALLCLELFLGWRFSA